MLKIKTSINKTKLAVIIVVVILAAGGLIVALEKTQTTNFIKISQPISQTNPEGPSEEERKIEAESNAQAKEQAIKDKSNQESTPEAPPPSENNIEIIAQQENNDSVTIMTKLKAIGSGTCSLKITNSSKTIEQEAEVIFQREYSTCAGFSIPKNKLGPGSWAITLNVSTPEKNITKSTSLEVK